MVANSSTAKVSALNDEVFRFGARHQRSTSTGGSSNRSTSVGSSDWCILERQESPGSPTRNPPPTVAASIVLPLFIVLDAALRLCFPDPSNKEKKVRADRLQTHDDGSVVVLADVSSGSATAVVEAAVGELCTDVRVAVEDDARFVPLVGARIRAGKVTSVKSSDNDGSAICEVAAPLSHEVSLMPLQDVVCELREREVHRHNAELERYQRALNAKMMGAQRQRYMQALVRA